MPRKVDEKTREIKDLARKVRDDVRELEAAATRPENRQSDVTRNDRNRERDKNPRRR